MTIHRENSSPERLTTLDEVLETCAVAIRLGQTVEAVEGMTIWRGRLYDDTLIARSNAGQKNDYVTPPCSSYSTAEALLANEALKILLASNGTVPWHPIGKTDISRDEDFAYAIAYIQQTSPETILKDCRRFLNWSSSIVKEKIVSGTPPRPEVSLQRYQRFTQLSLPLL